LTKDFPQNKTTQTNWFPAKQKEFPFRAEMSVNTYEAPIAKRNSVQLNSLSGRDITTIFRIMIKKSQDNLTHILIYLKC
jgi:hypothetical protein